jgi:hypothetical protein
MRLSIEEFKKALLKEVDSFVEYWEKKSVEHPAHYPAQMEREDWDEQHLLWLTTPTEEG